MSENNESQQQNHIMGRKIDRPMPPQGCSWAFFIFLALLFIGLFVAYLIFKHRG